MASKTKIELNSRAVAQLLKDPATVGLGRRVKAIAQAAGPGMEPSVTIGRTRARGSVVTATHEAREAEAKNRKLSSALWAGR